MPQLRRASGPRVVNVSSLAHRTGFIDFDDLQGARVYSPWKAYGQSKLAMLIFALELQRRSDAAGSNLTSNAAHPGFARTSLFASGPGGLLSSCDRFRGSILRAFGGGRSPTNPVRGDKPESKARRLLRPRWNRRIARRPSTGPDHAPGPRRGDGRQTLRLYRATCVYIVRMTVQSMQLRKNVIDVGLSTNNLEPKLRFWQQQFGLRFDHVLPVRRGQKQYRHDALGSVITLNHHPEPLPAAAPSGSRALTI